MLMTNISLAFYQRHISVLPVQVLLHVATCNREYWLYIKLLVAASLLSIFIDLI